MIQLLRLVGKAIFLIVACVNLYDLMKGTKHKGRGSEKR